MTVAKQDAHGARVPVRAAPHLLQRGLQAGLARAAHVQHGRDLVQLRGRGDKADASVGVLRQHQPAPAGQAPPVAPVGRPGARAAPPGSPARAGTRPGACAGRGRVRIRARRGASSPGRPAHGRHMPAVRRAHARRWRRLNSQHAGSATRLSCCNHRVLGGGGGGGGGPRSTSVSPVTRPHASGPAVAPAAAAIVCKRAAAATS